MKIVKMALLCSGIALATGNALAQDNKNAASPNDTKQMTMQQCKDQMAMARTDAMKTDPAMMKKDAACADMMKKDGTTTGTTTSGATTGTTSNGMMKGDTKK